MFNKLGIDDWYRQEISPRVRGEILRESDEQILGSDLSELQRYFYEKSAIPEIEEGRDDKPSYEIEDYLRTIRSREREEFYRGEGDLPDFECQRVILHVPLKRNEHISHLAGLRGKSFSISYSDSDFQWSATRVGYVIETKGYGFTHNKDQIAQNVEGALNRIWETIGFKNEAIRAGNAELETMIKKELQARSNKIKESADKIFALTKKISIPLKKKAVVGAKPIRVDEKPLITRLKPRPNLPEELVLDDARVKDIIEFLDGQAKNFETTPSAIKSLGEEDLRDLLLANLNSVFQGNATGETFSKRGKTDIYLKIDKGNILICECKIWGGPALYDKTICSIPDDHIDPRRSALFMARSVLGDIRENAQC
jgi:hypothetical protein